MQDDDELNELSNRGVVTTKNLSELLKPLLQQQVAAQRSADLRGIKYLEECESLAKKVPGFDTKSVLEYMRDNEIYSVKEAFETMKGTSIPTESNQPQGESDGYNLADALKKSLGGQEDKLEPKITKDNLASELSKAIGGAEEEL